MWVDLATVAGTFTGQVGLSCARKLAEHGWSSGVSAPVLPQLLSVTDYDLKVQKLPSPNLLLVKVFDHNSNRKANQESCLGP